MKHILWFSSFISQCPIFNDFIRFLTVVMTSSPTIQNRSELHINTYSCFVPLSLIKTCRILRCWFFLYLYYFHIYIWFNILNVFSSIFLYRCCSIYSSLSRVYKTNGLSSWFGQLNSFFLFISFSFLSANIKICVLFSFVNPHCVLHSTFCNFSYSLLPNIFIGMFVSVIPLE